MERHRCAIQDLCRSRIENGASRQRGSCDFDSCGFAACIVFCKTAGEQQAGYSAVIGKFIRFGIIDFVRAGCIHVYSGVIHNFGNIIAADYFQSIDCHAAGTERTHIIRRPGLALAE